MPKPIDKIPNPWVPYMDGQLWEFTEDEFRAMPYPPGPMTNRDYEVFGMRCMLWNMNNKHYVRFYSVPADPEVLAGWRELE